jgi:hypothetical protein
LVLHLSAILAAREPNTTLLDTNGDGFVDLSDAVGILGFLFLGTPGPALGSECVFISGCPLACVP